MFHAALNCVCVCRAQTGYYLLEWFTSLARDSGGSLAWCWTLDVVLINRRKGNRSKWSVWRNKPKKKHFPTFAKCISAIWSSLGCLSLIRYSSQIMLNDLVGEWLESTDSIPGGELEHSDNNQQSKTRWSCFLWDTSEATIVTLTNEIIHLWFFILF